MVVHSVEWHKMSGPARLSREKSLSLSLCLSLSFYVYRYNHWQKRWYNRNHSTYDKKAGQILNCKILANPKWNFCRSLWKSVWLILLNLEHDTTHRNPTSLELFNDELQHGLFPWNTQACPTLRCLEAVDDKNRVVGCQWVVLTRFFKYMYILL